MAPRPRKPPDEESEDFPPTWRRLPYWMRRSEHHPMVQSQPDEIINGTNAVINALRELRSPSPNVGGFSRFSSRATTPNNAVPGPSSQYPVYSYPPPPPPPLHYPPPLYLPPPSHPPPPVINLPCPPLIGGSQGQKGKCRSPFVTPTYCRYRNHRNISCSYRVPSS